MPLNSPQQNKQPSQGDGVISDQSDDLRIFPEKVGSNDEISLDEIWRDVTEFSISSKKNDAIAATKNFQIESDAKKLAVELYGKKQFLDLQKDWASHIRWQIWAVLAFQISFVLLVGFNPMGFTDNLNKLPYMYVGVILQTLANIVALGFVVAQFLFPNGKKKS